jgi:DNA-directed RNA polymerase subunit beta
MRMSNNNLTSISHNFYRQFFGYRRLDLVPNFLEMMKKSYQDFIQVDPNNRSPEKGLESVLIKTINFEDPKGNMALEYISYELKEPKFSVEECKLQGLTYGYSLFINCKAIFFDKEQRQKNKKVIIEEETVKIPMGEIPKMCSDGSFTINGIDKTIITQIQRIPGIFFTSEVKKRKKKLLYQNFSCKIIPYTGSWMEFFIEGKDAMYFKLDKKKKMSVATLLLSLAKNNNYKEEEPEAEGFSVKEILLHFYKSFKCTVKNDYIQRPIYEFDYNNYFFTQDVFNDNGEVLIGKGNLFTPSSELKDGFIGWVHKDDWMPMVCLDDLFLENGTIIQEISHLITKENLESIIKNKFHSFDIINTPNIPKNLIIANSFAEEDYSDREDACNKIVRSIRINDSNLGQLTSLYSIYVNTFFNKDNYNFDDIGRIVMNQRLELNVSEKILHMTNEDIFGAIKNFLKVIDDEGPMDDIDSLEHKRLRLVGENLTNQCLIGSKKMIKSMKDRLFMGESFSNRIKEVMSGKIFLYPLKKLFNVSIISQFEEQTNLISSLMHKRRLVYQAVSGTMPTGASNKNNKRRIEGIRDNHQSFYGMICPFSTPEGPNLGMVNSLGIFAKVNKYGLLQTSFHPVKNGEVDTQTVIEMTANEAKKFIIASTTDIVFDGDKAKIKNDLIIARKNLDFTAVYPKDITHVEISSDQILSLACSLIPYAESNDAFRILMASNMLRQAEPLKKPERALVGTGMEKLIVDESYNGSIKSPCNGSVVAVDGNRIILLDEDNHSMIVKHLTRFNCSNQNTSYGMRTIIKVGQRVKIGDIIADSESSVGGELACGSNALVAFITSAEGFEDSIWVNKKYAYDDRLTSFNIKVFEVQIRDSRLGHEMITRDIPGVSQTRLKHLDEEGIVMEGVHVKFGMILVGKVTPVSTHQFVPDQRLLHTIFGEKSSEIADTSFKAPAGTEGIVTKVEIIRRSGIDEDERLMAIETKKLYNIKKNVSETIYLLQKHLKETILKLCLNKPLNANFAKLAKGHVITEFDIVHLTNDENIPLEKFFNISVDAESKKIIEKYQGNYLKEKKIIEERGESLIVNAKTGRELPSGVLKIIRIHVMEERRIEEGDKITGRHGNKGVISKISPQQDMPYLADGTAIDIVMNPIGIKARMNPGLLLESVTGMACVAIVQKMREIANQPNFKIQDLDDYLKTIDLDIDKMTIPERDNFIRNLRIGNFMYCVAAQPFNRPSSEFLDKLLTLGGKDINGYEKVFDGLTGDFIGNICVGYQYILKLCHMAKDKIHSRFTGPYSFITQQPLCGKINYGGQRFGEMEVWAMEAYGAAFSLQEMLTIKSDAIRSRYKAAESIVNGESMYRTLDKPTTIMMLQKFLIAGGIDIHYQTKSTKEQDLEILVGDNLKETSEDFFGSMEPKDKLDNINNVESRNLFWETIN